MRTSINMDGWPKAAPQSEWTPFQREYMNEQARYHVRLRHQWRLAQWKMLQKQSYNWISFDDLADWCARKPSSIDRDDALRAQALNDLRASVLSGEFSKRGQVLVAYLPNDLPFARPFRLRLQIKQLSCCDLVHCWLPRARCVSWLKARDLKLPPWLSEPQVSESLAKASSPQRRGGLHYNNEDEPLISQMHLFLTAEPPNVRSVWAATDLVVNRAAGGGTPDAKRKRLMAGYKAKFSPVQS